ncbi:MAG: ECF transporter S component [Eubacteriales bacterium]
MKEAMKQMDAARGLASKANGKQRSKVRNMVQIAMLGSLSTILMFFQIPLWFAPPFYQLDFSEVPVLIGAFALGPVAGILIELVKILLNFALDGTITMGIGELANFLIGSSFLVPASICYRKMHTKKGAIYGLALGTICMVIVASLLNAFVLLPAYAVAFGMEDISTLVEMGSALNPSIHNLSTFILFAVAPFNLVKGALVSTVTLLLYKRIRFLLKPTQ